MSPKMRRDVVEYGLILTATVIDVVLILAIVRIAGG